MTGMLASVTSVNEADIVFRAGVDIIDIKDPVRGALGALDRNLCRDIVRHISGRILTSATVGDLPPDPLVIRDAITATAATGVDIVKVGLFADHLESPLLDIFRDKAAQGIGIIIVLFADKLSGFSLLDDLAGTGIKGVMLDTAMKDNGTLRTLLNDGELKCFVDQAQSTGMVTGLAGSLALEDIEPLLRVNPDYLGFRGALCSKHQRIEGIDEMSVHRVRNRIPMVMVDELPSTAIL